MNVHRDMWLAMSVVFIFITMVLSVIGAFYVAASWTEFRGAANIKEWLRTGVRYWPITVLDAISFLVAIFSYGKYKSTLDRW